MSVKNVEVVRRYLETGWPEPSESAEAAEARIAAYWESEADYYPVRSFPEAKPCHGREEITRFLSGFLAAWDEFRYVVEDTTPVGDDRVLARGHMRAEGRVSGLALEGDIYHSCWLRHGRFIRVEDHLTLRGALYALGLPGETLEAAGLSD